MDLFYGRATRTEAPNPPRVGITEKENLGSSPGFIRLETVLPMM